MDINDVRSLITVVSFVAFLAIVVWAYGTKRKSGFEEAARSVLEESDDDRVEGNVRGEGRK
ncbi:MAG: CcoQ/FixQ family Cbb3-type cytochrome c oxidase assembly chaperone [Burkholderiales bacterium]|jgi:cytochrome c oxidase cbb3-type subunit 4